MYRGQPLRMQLSLNSPVPPADSGRGGDESQKLSHTLWHSVTGTYVSEDPRNSEADGSGEEDKDQAAGLVLAESFILCGTKHTEHTSRASLCSSRVMTG
jgi:hypothetical protein